MGAEGGGLTKERPPVEEEKTTGVTTPVDTSIRVKVAQLGSELKVLDLPKDVTVGQAIEAAGFSAKEKQVKVNGKNADVGDKLKEGDIVVLATKIRLGHIVVYTVVAVLATVALLLLL